MQRVNVTARRSVTARLSIMMRICIEQMREWDGTIERYAGGMWAEPGGPACGDPCFDEATVVALKELGLIEFIRHKTLSDGQVIATNARLLRRADEVAPRSPPRPHCADPFLGRSARR